MSARGVASPPAAAPAASVRERAHSAAAPAHLSLLSSLQESQLARLLGPVIPNSPLLSCLSADDLSSLSLELRAFRSGEQLFHVGDDAKFFAISPSGTKKTGPNPYSFGIVPIV